MDHAATTPLDARVLKAMIPYFGEVYGNASSIHRFGQAAKQAAERARAEVAAFIGARPPELLFTSGGTEADNLALRGVLAANEGRGRHLIVSAIEHHAILHQAQDLMRRGQCELTILPVAKTGLLDLQALRRALRPDTVLVSVMLANNEIGTIEPIAEVSGLAHAAGAFVHTDAVQAAGQVDVDVSVLDVDLLSLSAHKIYGPKGIGALYVRSGLALDPVQVGGSQERGRRAGTENVPGMVGFGIAVRLAMEERDERRLHLGALQQRLIDGLLQIEGATLNGARAPRLPSNVNVSLQGLTGETVLLNLDLMGVAASAGSACTSGSLDPSHVLLALGQEPKQAAAAVRFSLGKDTTPEDVDRTVAAMVDIATRVRRLQERSVARHG